jgi:hypothetical protein
MKLSLVFYGYYLRSKILHDKDVCNLKVFISAVAAHFFYEITQYLLKDTEGHEVIAHSVQFA